MDRAFGVLELKSVDEESRTLTGVATRISPDRTEDIVDPRGAKFSLPLPFLWQHGKGQPAIGHVTRAQVTDDQIAVTVQLEKDDQPGPLKDLLDLAWRSIQKRLVRGMSIGFRPLEHPEPIKGTMGLHFKSWEWLELSAVTIPMHQEANILTVKSFAVHPDGATTPGMTGSFVRPSQGRSRPMTTAESIKNFSDRREAVQKDMAAIMTAASEKNETLDAEQSDKYDAYKAELESIDKHLDRLRDFEKVMAMTAKAVVATDTQTATASRGNTPVVQITDNLPKGIGFTRVAIARVLARIDQKTVTEVINERWPDDTRVKQFFQKAAVPAGTSTHATWAGPLVDQTNLASEFVEFLRPQTIIGRIPNLRRVPFNIRFTSQTTGAVANWVGEGRAKPVTSFQTAANTLLYTKIATIAVITQELARFSAPSAEAMVRDELARAVIEKMDNDFIDPATAAVAGVNPASITNGLTALSSSGPTADNIRTDIQNLLEQFILNNMNAASVVLIMPNTLALAASLLRNSLGQPEFSGLGINGGTLEGIPVITSQYAANQSQYGNLVIALDPTAILLADDGQVDVSVSMEASLEMSDAPTNRSDTPTAASLVSLWQTNSVGIKAERFINWVKARSTAVVYMDDVNWGSIGSPS